MTFQQMMKQVIHISGTKIKSKAIAVSFFYLVCLLSLSFACIAQTDLEVLNPTSSINGKVTQARTKSYKLHLEKNQFVRVMIRQITAELKMKFYSSDNRLIAETAPPKGRYEEARLGFVAETTADYRIEIELTSKDFDETEFILKLEVLRDAEQHDRELVSAEKLFMEGEYLRVQDDESARQNAIKKYESALTVFVKAKDKPRQAEALRNIGFMYRVLGNPKQTITYYDQAILLFRELTDKSSEATLLSQKAESYYSLGEVKTSLSLCEEALKLFREIDNGEMVLQVTQNMGVIYSSIGESRKALEMFKQLLPDLEKGGESRRLATLYSNIGDIYEEFGDFTNAKIYYDKALQMRRELNDVRGQIYTLNNISGVYNENGEVQKTLDCLDEALDLTRKIGDQNLEAILLSNKGAYYDELGKKEQALALLTQSLVILRNVGNKGSEAYTLLKLGTILNSTGRSKEALESDTKALSLMKETSNKNGESRALTSIGEVYFTLRDIRKALEYLNQALVLTKEVGDKSWQAYLLERIAQSQRESGDKINAIETYKEALTIAHALSMKRSEASILFGMAQIERENGNLNAARENLENCLGIVENQRGQLTRSDLRTSYLSSIQKGYETYINLLMELDRREPNKGFSALAFRANEKARARSLLEALEEARKNIRQGVSTELLERERTLQQQLNARENYRRQLLIGNAGSEQIKLAEKEIQELLNQYQEIQAQIRAKSPRYTSLTQPRVLTVEEIQKEVLDSDTILLEYSLGEKQSFLWVVTQNSFNAYELQSREKIETTTRRVYELMTERIRVVENETAEQRQRRIQKADEDFKKACGELSRLLSISVIQKTNAKRLVIVADGSLQYIPFAILQSPKSQISGTKSENGTANSEFKTQNSELIINKYEIINLPSASTIFALREDLKGRIPAQKSVAIFADPVFRANDSRIQPKVKDSNLQLTVDKRTAEFVRLQFSRQEAEYISQLVQPKERFLAIDFSANRTTVQNTELSQYRIIHFATHGLLDSNNPELSGLVFSLFDEKGKSVEGFLRLHEIYNIKLNANLVVLSACQTALGKEIRGEGLVGLTRGFMYAGAPRVTASLWRVDDRATAELMKRYYQAMLKEKMLPASALRLAQLSLMKDVRWSAPYYWAAFVLQGEWR